MTVRCASHLSKFEFLRKKGKPNDSIKMINSSSQVNLRITEIDMISPETLSTLDLI